MPTTYAIPNGRTVMDATLYTGTGAAANVTNQYGFKPDLVWVKLRSGAASNRLVDSNRGATLEIYSNTTDAEYAATQGVTAFNTNGFALGTDTGYNGSTSTYVGWQWQAGQGTTSSNTSGTITSTVSANATAGFSIVKYTGNGTSGATIGHGLGATPYFILVKNRTTAGPEWNVYHQSLGNTGGLFLNTTNTFVTASNMWNNTSPTSTLITLGNGGNANTNGANYVAYCWTQIAGFSQFGSYTGNGSSDGPFIYTGFRPKFVLYKAATGTAYYWSIYDTSRDPYNVPTKLLYPNVSNAEDSPYLYMDIVSNGFKIRATGNLNENGSSYIYAAFAENPFKYANAR